MVNSYGKKYNIKGLIYYFYIEFLLKKYAFVLSDDALTEKAFTFWKSNFDNFIKNGYKVYVVDFNVATKNISNIKSLDSKEEMDQYYGNIMDNRLKTRVRYMLSK